MKDKDTQQFSAIVLAWGKSHSRKDFPWQIPDPYKVWVSEIMLQQTQTKTVEKYFSKFIQRFPSVQSLAQAKLDEVMLLWAGLGYYRRAKNLHQAAMQIATANQLPEDLDEWLQLPGIGKSTAGAIISLATDKPEVVLDANVARVIHRCVLGVESKKIDKLSWDTASNLLPNNHGRLYSQSMMDLGAVLCKADSQICGDCPLAKQCQWLKKGRPMIASDTKNLAKLKQVMQIRWIIYLHKPSKQIYLQPSKYQQHINDGIWPNLWLPIGVSPADDLAIQDTVNNGMQPKLQKSIDIVHHLTHKKLHINCTIIEINDRVINQSGTWVNLVNIDQIVALPSVVKKIINQMEINS